MALHVGRSEQPLSTTYTTNGYWLLKMTYAINLDLAQMTFFLSDTEP